MARQARRLVDGGVYRIIACSPPTLALFREPADYEVYLMMLAAAKRQTGLKLFHYCLLPTEAHLIVELPRTKALARTLHQTHLRFRWHHRKKYQTSGSLWRDRFQCEPMAPDDILMIGQRVESLPMRDGLTAHPADYPYSSYTHYAFGRPNPSLDAHPHYLALAATAQRRQERYCKFSTSEYVTRMQPRLTHMSVGRSPNVSSPR